MLRYCYFKIENIISHRLYVNSNLLRFETIFLYGSNSVYNFGQFVYYVKTHG